MDVFNTYRILCFNNQSFLLTCALSKTQKWYYTIFLNSYSLEVKVSVLQSLNCFEGLCTILLVQGKVAGPVKAIALYAARKGSLSFRTCFRQNL
jgi:hypothetical protein